MRKFSKILTLVLALSLLCGMVAVAASAATISDTTGALTVSGDGIQYTSSTDFEDGKISTGYLTQVYGGDANNGGTATGLVDNFTVAEQASGNKYAQYYGLSSETKLYAGAWFAPLITATQFRKPTAAESAMLNDYTVFDFDITSDAYLSGGAFTADSDAADSLAYQAFNINILSRFWAPAQKWFGNSQVMYILTDNTTDENGLTKWYISNGKGAQYQLPNTLGEWTHVTVVFDYDNTVVYADGTTGKYESAKKDDVKTLNIANSIAYVYVNGQYLYSFAPFPATTTQGVDITTIDSFIDTEGVNHIEEMFLDSFRCAPINYKTKDFSIGLDNIAVHHYATGYAGDLAADFADGAPSNLFGTTDVVYNGSYISPNGAVGTIAGTSYTSQEALHAAITEGCTVNLTSNSFMPYAPTAPFTVVTNGYSFKLDGSANYMLKETATAGTYSVVPATEAEYIIYDNTTGDVISYGADINNLLTEYASLSATNVKIVLQNDLLITDISTAHEFEVSGKSLELDLNGYDITQHTIDTRTSGSKIPALFRFNAGGTVNAYSSKAGSEIVALSWQAKDGAGVENTAGVVYINNTFSTGKVDITIKNLTFHTTILFQSYSKVETNLTLDGVNYFAPSSNGRGHIQVRNIGAHTITATNSTFAATTGHFFYVDEGFGVNATFDRCVIAGSNLAFSSKSDSHKATCLDKSKIVINDSDIYVGSMHFWKAAEGCIVLGEGTRFNIAIPDTGYIVAEDGMEVITYSGETETTVYSIFHPVVSNDTSNPEFTVNSINLTVNAAYKYEVCAPREEITVTWMHGNKVLGKETYYEGQIASYKGNNVISREDDSLWISYGIAGWENEDGNNNLKVSKNNNLFFAVEGDVIDVQSLYNFRTDNNFTRFVYVPVPTEESGIVVTSITDDFRLTSGAPTEILNTPSRVAIVLIDGVEYYRINDTPGVVGDFVQNYTVSYTWGETEGKYTVSAECMAGYFAQVLADDTQCDEARVLAANAANYMKAVWAYVGKTSDTIDAIVSDYADLLITASDDTIAADAKLASMEGLSGIVSGATFVIGDGFTPSLAIIISDYTTAAKGSYTSNDGNFYQFNFKHANYHYKGSEGFNAETTDNNSNNYLRVTETFGIYNACETITITVGEATGTYNLATYITYLESLETLTDAQAKALTVAKAMYAYSEASLAYKTRSQAK